jgi:hypothetical protein
LIFILLAGCAGNSSFTINVTGSGLEGRWPRTWVFNRSLEKLPQEERPGIMQITNSWKEEGRNKGLVEGSRLSGRSHS